MAILHLPAVLGVILLAGCSRFRTEWGHPLPESARLFGEGDADVGTVLDQLGPPAQVTALPGGFAFLYEHSVVDEIQLGVSINVPVLKWFKFINASNQLDQDIMLMVFDDEGVLRSMDSEEWEEELGGGGAVQFLFSTMSLTDDSALRERSLQHFWGRDDLRPLPIVLNSPHNLRSGEHGLQQRLVPTKVGQHTLEMTRRESKKKRRKQTSLR